MEATCSDGLLRPPGASGALRQAAGGLAGQQERRGSTRHRQHPLARQPSTQLPPPLHASTSRPQVAARGLQAAETGLLPPPVHAAPQHSPSPAPAPAHGAAAPRGPLRRRGAGFALGLQTACISKGAPLRWACKGLMRLSLMCVLLACVLLWKVCPKQYDYGRVIGQGREFELSQRVGKLPANYSIPWRHDALTYERGPAKLGFGSLEGGWMTNGLAGTVKVTLPTAFSVAMSAWSLLAFPEGYRAGNHTAAARDSLKWGADYLLKTFVADPTSRDGALHDYYIVHQVGNYTADSAVWTRPEDIRIRRLVYYTTTKNGTSDLVGQLVGALVSTALVFQDADPPYYNTLMTSAMGLYGAGLHRRGRYTRTFLDACAPPDPTQLLSTPAATNCQPPDVAFDGSMVYNYNSTSYRDDLAWAAAWMYKATRDPGYLADAYNYWQQHINEEGDLDIRYLVDWDNVIYPASILLAELTDNMAFHSKAQSFLQKWLCSSGNTISYTPLGCAYNRFSPSLSTSMNAARLSTVYGNIIAPPTNVPRTQLVHPCSDGCRRERYRCRAQPQSDCALGDHTPVFADPGLALAFILVPRDVVNWGPLMGQTGAAAVVHAASVLCAPQSP